jgi:hypothetical protein
MYGILTDIDFSKHWIFKNYYYGLKNLLGEENIKFVKSQKDLENVHTLFIGDEHFGPNKEIWMNDSFIDNCNIKNIEVIIFNNEKIYNSIYSWNETIQKNVEKFKNRNQYVYDVDDANIINTKVNKTFMSREFLNVFDLKKEKKEKILFIGSLNHPSYSDRKKLINDISSVLDVEVIQSDPSLSMNDYMNKISGYKYILCPLGIGNFVAMRYYETLFVNSIPLQQSNELINYQFSKEISDNRGVFFSTVDELVEKINVHEYSVPNKIYYEDFLGEILRKNI